MRFEELPPMDEIHNIILTSLEKSDLFVTDRVRELVVIILDMFMHKCNALEFFIENYQIINDDYELFFKKRLIELHDEDYYERLMRKGGRINV